jgi:hypothetical protein
MNPASREELKHYILRSLGHPVIDINIADEQMEDRIDDALLFWQEYHSDGTQRYYIAHQVTAEDKANRYITLPDNVYTVNRAFIGKDGNGYSSSSILSTQAQIRLSDVFNITAYDLGGYYIANQYLSLLNETLAGKTISTYKRYERKAYIETSWDNIAEGQFVLFDVFAFLDPEEFVGIYGDRVFRRLATAYCKRQWGENLLKLKNVVLAGGITLNGEVIFYEGKAEIMDIEMNFRRNYSDPDLFFVG